MKKIVDKPCEKCFRTMLKVNIFRKFCWGCIREKYRDSKDKSYEKHDDKESSS